MLGSPSGAGAAPTRTASTNSGRLALARHAVAAASLGVIVLNLVLWCVPLAFLAVTKLVLPGARPRAERLMSWIYRAAVRIHDWWLNRIVGIHWGPAIAGIDSAASYVILANHRSWADILVIQSVVARHGPLVKFLVKRELVWIPVLGLIFWAFDFPLLERSARDGDEIARRDRDVGTIERACEAIKAHPAALVSFVEGTRFSNAKQRAGRGRYKHLLKPRPGGFLAIVDALREDADAVIDLTIDYHGEGGFWPFLAGRPRRVSVHAELFPLAELPEDREQLAAWLSERWHAKDKLLGAKRKNA